MATTDEILELGRRWSRVEVDGDARTLDEIGARGVHLVGPAGFVLDRDQWLERYGTDRALYISELCWEDVDVRSYGDTAVAIGAQTQRGSYAGNPVDGRFRVTQVAVREDGDWKIASLHYSPIGGPPPFTEPRASR